MDNFERNRKNTFKKMVFEESLGFNRLKNRKITLSRQRTMEKFERNRKNVKRLFGRNLGVKDGKRKNHTFVKMSLQKKRILIFS